MTHINSGYDALRYLERENGDYLQLSYATLFYSFNASLTNGYSKRLIAIYVFKSSVGGGGGSVKLRCSAQSVVALRWESPEVDKSH